MGKLEEKVALVTGAARGQGEAIARRFAAEGAQVVITDVLDDQGEALASDLGDRSLYCHLDVSQPSQWAAALSLTEERFGRLDVLVNNAGILTRAPLENLRIEEYMRTVEVNQVGCLLGMQASLPLLKVRGGSIINTSSVAGIRGIPGLAAYASTKWAIRGLTRTAAAEFGEHGIRVNSIHPGAVATPMLAGATNEPLSPESRQARVPLGRIGEPEEIAHLVLFLASDESSFCTGSEFTIDGGSLAGLRSR